MNIKQQLEMQAMYDKQAAEAAETKPEAEKPAPRKPKAPANAK